MHLRIRRLTQEDYLVWEEKARALFSKEDFCDAKYLINFKDKVKGWCLINDKEEWVGCCFINTKSHSFNRDGVHFLEICTFPKFRGRGYGKYLLKIMFDNSLNKTKSACIAPNNNASIRLFEKYGFKESGRHKCWKVYLCDKDYYPPLVKSLELKEVYLKLS